MSLHVLLPVVLLTALALGGLAARVRLPRVLGEIAAGLVLGGAGLGFLSDATPEARTFGELAQIGLCVLLFRVGLETDLRDLRREARPAATLGAAGMLVPLIGGVLVASLFGAGWMSALFVGAAISATSVGVSASVLEEANLTRTSSATAVVGAAVVDDVLGLVLLAALVGTLDGEASLLTAGALAATKAAAFLVIAPTAGALLERALEGWWGRDRGRGGLFVIVVSALLLTAAAAHAVGLEMIIGAYALGLGMGRALDRERLLGELDPLLRLFTPLFFVSIGLELNPGSLGGGSLGVTLLFITLLLAVACAGKVVVAGLLPKLELPRLAIGWAMVPRGEVGFIFAKIGLASHALTQRQFGEVAAVIALTTLVGPIALRRYLTRVKDHDDE